MRPKSFGSFARVACLFVSAAGLLGGCGSGSGSRPDGGAVTCAPATGTGDVIVQITGLPAGVAADVILAPASGGGTTFPATASTTLMVPAAGYRATAVKVAADDPIVRAVYQPTVTMGATVCASPVAPVTVAVAYALVPSSNKVWFGNGNGGAAPLLGFAGADLAATGSPAAAVAAMTAGATAPAFDADGNLWVIGATSADAPVARFAAGTLGGSGAKTPDVTIDSAPFRAGVPGAAALAFDKTGGLWVSVVAARQVIRFAPAQLTASGSPTPAVVLSDIEGPAGLAFDAAGNLWVASSEARILKFAASRLAASTTGPDLSIEAQTPAPVIGTLSDPIGLAFDGAGNLWVNYDGKLARLTAADRAGAGDKTVTPAVQVGLDVAALPTGIAFDEGGGLWLAYAAGKFARLSAGQLAASGDVPPSTIVTSADVGYAAWVALYPAPAALPLYSRLP
ncbi:MAG: hypothetical protein ABUS79_01845 [Pseudomonadota bacterium]